jgi:hypothetical protein
MGGAEKPLKWSGRGRSPLRPLYVGRQGEAGLPRFVDSKTISGTGSAHALSFRALCWRWRLAPALRRVGAMLQPGEVAPRVGGAGTAFGGEPCPFLSG